MKEKLSKLFISDSNMLKGLFLSFVFVFANVLNAFSENNSLNRLLAIERLFIFVMLVITIVSYFKHDKNIMKCSIGVSFGITIVSELTSIMLSELNIINVVGLVLSIVILLSHLLINSDHNSSPKKIKFNQTSLIVCALLLVVLSIKSVITNGWSLSFARELSIYLFYFMCIWILICIESKLDFYRIQREIK